MAMASGSSGGAKSDINVTPLVDVVLVLLIIFMVVTPMLQRGKDVQLPKASQISEEGEGKADPLILSITPDKKMYVESDEMTDDVALRNRLEVEIQKDAYRRLLLKGDMALTFGDVRKVMKIARDAGAKGVALGVEEQK